MEEILVTDIKNIGDYIKYIEKLKLFYSKMFNNYRRGNEPDNYSMEQIKKKFEDIDNNLDGKLHDDLEFFFRGQSKYSYNLAPSIERDGLEKNEVNIIKETFSDRPKEFETSFNMFDKLIKMQHYGIPTRLLDLTGNSMAALYFACESKGDVKKENNADGAIFLFTQSKQRIKDYDSDSVSLLSNMSLIDKYQPCPTNYYKANHIESLEIFKKYMSKLLNIDIKNQNNRFLEIQTALEDKKYDLKSFKKNIDFMKKAIRDWSRHSTFSDIDYIDNIPYLDPNNVTLIKPDIDLDKELQSYINDINNLYFLYNCHYCPNLNRENCKEKLIDLVKHEKPHFQDRINVLDLYKLQTVRGIKSNERIRAQDGHFIIVPKLLGENDNLKGLMLSKRSFDNDGVQNPIRNKESSIKYIQFIEEPYIHKIKIKAEHKKNILKELNNIGINRASIYPELHEYAKHINNKYAVREKKK